jgi:hypothetical protein
MTVEEIVRKAFADCDRVQDKLGFNAVAPVVPRSRGTSGTTGAKLSVCENELLREANRISWALMDLQDAETTINVLKLYEDKSREATKRYIDYRPQKSPAPEGKKGGIVLC